MNNMETKEQTLALIDTMIMHADEGPSGFWVEEHEGCGNPRIFPEFEEGLKNGRLVHKKHYLCPWNTAVLFGSGHGNIHTGCSHSCSIEETRFLPAAKLKEILIRFRQRLLDGDYADIDALRPLLTEEEYGLIRRQKELLRKEQTRKSEEEAKSRRERAEKLAQWFRDDPYLQELIRTNYGENRSVYTEDYGYLHFSPDGMLGIDGGEQLTYDEYIALQVRSHAKTRTSFEQCYFELGLSYCGEIVKKKKDRICFDRILISGMYSDGTMFDAKEDHVWMDIAGFEAYEVGDAVSFGAEVYRYIKTGNGKILDYGLQNPKQITKIDPYTLPTDEELMAQEMRLLQCENCYLSEHCNRVTCILSHPDDAEEVEGQ